MKATTEHSQQIYVVKDLMAILNIGKDRAYALMRSKTFPSTQIGKTYFVTVENFDAWLNNSAGKHIDL